jgi:phosphatidylglycerophosphate synthase
MPPFADVLKSRDVEDPINLWVHRPIAYAFCTLVFRTSMTPNQVTLIAIFLGMAAAACWVEGSPRAMLWGGILLWSSAIMDGADGILARAKRLQSAFGRALDGFADYLVGLSSVCGCIYHLYVTGERTLLFFAVPAFVTTIIEFNGYDFYKEIWMHMTRIDRQREGHLVSDIDKLRASESAKTAPWYTRISLFLYADLTRNQDRLIRLTNKPARRLLTEARRSRASADTYRQLNHLPMQFWKALSTAPHAYLFSIFAMFDRLDLYLWLRLLGMGPLALIAFVLQRRATARTLSAFEASGWLIDSEPSARIPYMPR